MAIKRVEALALGELLGSLMGSVVEAQARAARTTLDFIEEVGFEKNEEGDDVMRSARLRFTKKDENDEIAEFEVEVPLLSLVNVPSLAVREANLAFSYDVVSASSQASPAARAATGSSSSDSPVLNAAAISRTFLSDTKLKPAVITGIVRPKPGTSPADRRTTAIDLDVTLAQQEVPIGLERLFDLAELGITERPVVEEDDEQ